MTTPLDYWKEPDDRNPTLRYWGNVDAGKRSAYLVDILNHFAPDKNKAILEVGCNVGRNLAYLWNNGYTDLTGVEVNEEAVEIARSVMKDYVSIIHGDLATCEKVGQFPVVFTMAVLCHIPSDVVISRIALNIATELIITLEDEVTDGPRHFARNYQKFFEELGWKQVHVYEEIPGLTGRYKGRVFKK